MVPAKKGPFPKRPYYELLEIEKICDEELKSLGLFPASPCPVRIERFIEKRFGQSAEYEILPPGVLGLTQFGVGGVEKIVVSKPLSEDRSKTAQRRVTTTLAHEVGHGLLHSHLFARDDSDQSLFLFEGHADVSRTQVLCRHEEEPEPSISKVSTANGPIQIKSRYNGQWWEFQANQAMGVLVLPRVLVMKLLGTNDFLLPIGSLGLKTLDEEKRDKAIMHVADVFDVNPVVARFRLAALFPSENTKQLIL